MEQVLTHHCIDDLPAQDRAMETFRRHFPFPNRQVTVSEDGRIMTFRLRSSLMTANYLHMARIIIACFHLPLQVEHDEFKIGTVVFENNMVITYTGR